MAKTAKTAWAFVPRFRRHAFGWRSQPAIRRVREAVSEIKQVARRDPMLGAEGAVLFLEKVSPALAHVDSSSGAIGTAVNRAIEALVPIIGKAPAAAKTRAHWLDRLWIAHQEDQIPYIERLGDHWGALCASKETASAWADRWVEHVKWSWSLDPGLRVHFHGTMACFSALLHAERYDEILALLDKAPFTLWHYRQWGVKTLVALGRPADALRYAEASRNSYDSPAAIARACEQILLAAGLAEEAYARYAVEANQAGSYLATYRAIARKYPHKPAADILNDLVATTPGAEGKWFAAAKDAGLTDEAIALANRSPCDPRTLSRAARDYAEKNPVFAVEAGLTALRWLVEGYGYEITGPDVRAAYAETMKAAEHAGRTGEIRERIRRLVAGETVGERFVTRILGRDLGLS